MNKVVTTLMKVATASSCLAVVLGICGCSWLNGDPLWLGGGQKSVTVRKRVSTLFDTQYDLKSGNMPFTFVADGGDVELGLFGHVRGCPDPNDRISKDAVVVFEVADEGYGATVFRSATASCDWNGRAKDSRRPMSPIHMKSTAQNCRLMTWKRALTWLTVC